MTFYDYFKIFKKYLDLKSFPKLELSNAMMMVGAVRVFLKDANLASNMFALIFLSSEILRFLWFIKKTSKNSISKNSQKVKLATLWWVVAMVLYRFANHASNNDYSNCFCFRNFTFSLIFLTIFKKFRFKKISQKLRLATLCWGAAKVFSGIVNHASKYVCPIFFISQDLTSYDFLKSYQKISKTSQKLILATL